MERILNRIADGSSTEAAVQEVLHSNYDDLVQATVEYLRKNLRCGRRRIDFSPAGHVDPIESRAVQQRGQ